MDKKIANYIKTHKELILSRWKSEMKEQGDERFVRVVSNRVFDGASQQFIDLIVSNLMESNEEFSQRLHKFAENVVHIGWPLNFVTQGIRKFNEIIFHGMSEEGVVTRENYMEFTEGFDKWFGPMNDEILSTYTSTWERTVTLQKIALKELSAQLIPVFEGISVMPLIGTIDTERAKQIMENLLHGVVKHRSEVVLIDITGVPIIDTMIAHHLIQAAESVRLVGAKCMLVGIRPEIAQTIVTLGINLDSLITKNTLQAGIEAALEMTNRKIVGVEVES
ncbi:STAS domain-containing protein [Caldibacillus lycopersici]|uniref:STAS domain-containing protein n=1 Tax=Perspicuibacillus lycopersici TaxID=1325689 RepID=A0AAE3IYA6_9BACI|nr:STAS domain-containing protein [Perspicuibacillus lycopersici]MCU9615164.1 STAS domain-containing protein [Perspicuibacillus lycopersici]